MNRAVRHMWQHTGRLAGLLTALVISLALAAPASAEKGSGITAAFDSTTGVLAVKGDD